MKISLLLTLFLTVMLYCTDDLSLAPGAQNRNLWKQKAKYTSDVEERTSQAAFVQGNAGYVINGCLLSYGDTATRR